MSWVLCEDMNQLVEKANEYGKLNDEYRNAYKYVESMCLVDAFSLPAEKIKDEIEDVLSKLQSYYYNVDRIVFTERRKSEKR